MQGVVLSTTNVFVQYVNRPLTYALLKRERNFLKVTGAKKNGELNKNRESAW